MRLSIYTKQLPVWPHWSGESAQNNLPPKIGEGSSPKRRTPSIKQIEKRSGRTVRAVTYAADGSKTFSFVEADTEQSTNPFDIEEAALRGKKTKQP